MCKRREAHDLHVCQTVDLTNNPIGQDNDQVSGRRKSNFHGQLSSTNDFRIWKQKMMITVKVYKVRQLAYVVHGFEPSFGRHDSDCPGAPRLTQRDSSKQYSHAKLGRSPLGGISAGAICMENTKQTQLSYSYPTQIQFSFLRHFCSGPSVEVNRTKRIWGVSGRAERTVGNRSFSKIKHQSKNVFEMRKKRN